MSTPPEADPAASAIDWRAATLGVAVIAVTILPTFLTGALGVRIGDELGVDLSGIGALYAVLFGVSALTSTQTGRLAERIGWAWSIRASALGTAGILGALAVLPAAWWEVWWPVGLLFAGGGFLAALSQGGSNLALAGAVPRARYGLVFGLKHTAVPAAAMLSGLAVPTVALTIGWRWAYAIAAVLGAVVALGVPHRDGKGPPRARRNGGRPRTPVGTLAALAVAAALAHTGLDAMTVIVVPFAVAEGISEGAAGLLLTIGSLAGLAVRLGSGFAVDRRQETGLTWMTALLAAGAAGFLLLAVTGSAILALAVIVAFGGAWGWAGLLTFVVVRANPEAPAAATGVANTGKYVGAASGPFLAGVVAEQVSFAAAWWLGFAVLAASALIVAALRITPSGRRMAAEPGQSAP